MELEDVYARNEDIISRRIIDELILVPIRKSVANMETSGSSRHSSSETLSRNRPTP